jgi:hypothetical protein
VHRTNLLILALLPSLSLLSGEGPSPSPGQQFDALVKETEQVRRDYHKAFAAAKTDADRGKATSEYEAKKGRIANGFLTLAGAKPGGSLAVDALCKLFALDGSELEKKKAVDLLLRDYLRNEKVAPVCQFIAVRYDRDSEAFLRDLLAGNPNRGVRAEASFALAHVRGSRLQIAREVQQDPNQVGPMERITGKETVAELLKANADTLEKDVAKTWSEFAEHYSADVPEDRLSTACAWLTYGGTFEVEPALRTLVKDKRRAIRGISSLALGQLLRRQADAAAEKGDEAAAKLRDESAEALRTAEKLGDAKIRWGENNFGEPVGEKARRELYELLHLSVGLKAPEIEGEDQDGKRFKLSDYRGKVVLLDFWSRH